MTDKIKEQAKAIMDEFMKALENAGITEDLPMDESQESSRQAKVSGAAPGFRELMLSNAPKKDSGHVKAERKSW